jgi:hypothetical protein
LERDVPPAPADAFWQGLQELGTEPWMQADDGDAIRTASSPNARATTNITSKI